MLEIVTDAFENLGPDVIDSAPENFHEQMEGMLSIPIGPVEDYVAIVEEGLGHSQLPAAALPRQNPKKRALP